MKIPKCLAEKKMIEEKKKETETSTLTGTVETEQSVQSAESSNEGEDSNSCGLGYNHFYNYPCAGWSGEKLEFFRIIFNLKVSLEI